MQLAKGSAEDLPSGLAANFRAFDFTWLSIERVDSTDGLNKGVCGLRRGEAEPTCIKTSTRFIVKRFRHAFSD